MAKTAPVTMAIIAIDIAIFFLVFLVSAAAPIAGFPLGFKLQLFRPAVAAGQWYRLFTAMFLHGSIWHLALNMYVLWIYGPHVEQALGKVCYALAYVLAGLSASALSYALGPCEVGSVGASGAIFGIVGVLLVYLYKRRRSTFVGQFLRGVMFFIVANLILGFLIPRVDNVAHIGGLIGGIIIGVGFDREQQGSSGAAVSVATATVVIGLSVAAIVLRTSVASCFPLNV